MISGGSSDSGSACSSTKQEKRLKRRLLGIMGQSRSKASIADSTYMPEYNYNAHEEESGLIESNNNQFFSLSVGNNKDQTDDMSSGTSDSSSPNDGAVSKEPRNWQRTYTLVLYSLTTVLLFADQNLLAPNLSAAAEEFGFDNDQRDKKLGGDIALAFFLLGAPASFLVGCCADSDSIPRSFLFGLTVLIGEGACFFTYFTTTYSGLYITRALTGFSVGGALPLLSSVLGDWFPPEERSGVMASVGVGTGIGIALGQGIAGFMGPIYGWRSPFLAVSIPALIVAILLMTTVTDPARGASENVSLLNTVESQQDADTSPNNSFANDEIHPTSLERKSSFRCERHPASLEIISNEDSSDNTREQIQSSNSQDEKESKCQVCFSLFKPSTYAPHLKTTKELLKSKTVLLALIQGAPGTCYKTNFFFFNSSSSTKLSFFFLLFCCLF